MPADSIHIADIRRDYQLAALDDETAGDNPLFFFGKWFAEAQAAQVDEVNAMTLATVDASAMPHARVVLLKGLDEKGVIFFTNYNSSKGQEIAANNHVAAVFFWKELERQVRIEGRAEKISEIESEAYFHTRPEASRIGAWASPQSQIITSRDTIEQNYHSFAEQFSGNIPRPSHWGGYHIIPSVIEFWQGRPSRLHDRLRFSRNPQGWSKCRLAP